MTRVRRSSHEVSRLRFPGHHGSHERAVRDFAEEGIEVLADDSVEHGVVGVAGLIRAMRVGHAMA